MRDTQNRTEHRGNLYLLTGLVIGLILGVLYSWVISPVEYVDTDPSSLSAAYKDEYRRVIALAYNANGDLARARERLALIDSGDVIQPLAAQAQRMLAENQPPEEARMVAVLAADLSNAAAVSIAPTQPVVVEQPTEAQEQETTAPTEAATMEIAAAIQTPTVPKPTPTATRSPMPTFTPRPTATPLRFLDSPFSLTSRQELCGGDVKAGLMQFEVLDNTDKPIPGVHITVTWNGGEDIMYTGLVPEIDPGYADFVMTPGVVYSLMVGDASKTVSGLEIPSCGGGLVLTFQQGN